MSAMSAGCRVRQAVERNLQLDPARRIGFDEIDELPGNHPRRDLGQQRVQRAGGHDSFQQAANRAASSNVHGGQLENQVLVTDLLVDVDVIHTDDFSAMYVDDLLVEQIAAQQE